MGDPRRRVPRTDAVLADPRLVEAQQVLGRALVKSVVADAQQRARDGEIDPGQVADHAVAALPRSAATLR
ncbi:L-seryl-tRNA(Sec) selenium transferase, partial [Mycobacterium rufum]|nr:L-seryl-tRNA(Sec) selenium transferase [Mycolicibacterium rufum]